MKVSEMDKILDVIIAFNREKNYFDLLNVILDKMMELTRADAGTVYALEDNNLYFRIMRNNSMNIFLGEKETSSMPPIALDESNIENISAFVGIKNEVVSIDDVYTDKSFNFSGPKEYDKKTGYRTHSMLVFPLTATTDDGTSVIGVLQLINSINEETGEVQSFSGIFDRSVLLALSNVSANALANILYIKHLAKTLTERERMRSELAIAQSIQKSVLPSEFPAFPQRAEFDIYALMKPAKDVGGDLYDFFMIGGQTLAIVIGDVSGKGVPASLFMMVARTLIKNESRFNRSTDEIFEKVNRQLCEDNESFLFVTAFIGLYDIKTGSLQYTNAGHCLPVIKRQDGTAEYLEGARSAVLAAFDTSKYTSRVTTLNAGDALVLYTDGVTEAFNIRDEQFSDERLLALIEKTDAESPRKLIETILFEVESFAKEVEQHDDITLLSLKRLPQRLGTIERADEITVPADTKFLDEVFDFVLSELNVHSICADTEAQILTAVEEIFVNIASYAYAPKTGDVTVRRRVIDEPPRLIVQFIDRGRPYNPLEKKSPDISLSAEERKIGGLGIFIVKKQMDDAFYEYSSGKNMFTISKRLSK